MSCWNITTNSALLLSWFPNSSWCPISNDPSFCQKHPGVPDGSDSSDRASSPLTENYTLPVALHMYLLYFVVSYTHHQNDTCVTLFAGAAVMLKPVTYCLAMFMSFSSQVPHCTSLLLLYIRCCTLPICLVLRCCHIFQYSFCFGYIACRCICFTIIVFYRSEIYCPNFKLTSTIPSVLHILRWSTIGLRYFILLIRIRIIAMSNLHTL